MKINPTELPGVLLIEPRVFGDARGYFVETWSLERYRAHGLQLPFVQDNLSKSGAGTLRGLHLQHPFGQGKLVQVIQGEVYDVALDVRVGSPSFGKWFGALLSEENKHQLFIPPGFAHGFCVTSTAAVFAYKCTDGYHPEAEITIAHDDPSLGIPWPVTAPTLSEKDRAGLRLADIPEDRLPRYDAPGGDS
jgi:dTDP-4-dehydrorhamnose 3,5-epimerase